jgi:hypothetical protein
MADPELEEGEVLATDGDQTKVCSRAAIGDCGDMRSEGSDADFLSTLHDCVSAGAWPAV